jgi:hypothetical protein
MTIRILDKEIRELITSKSFFYFGSKYHFDITQQNIPVEDNGFIVTPNPIYSSHYLSTAGKRKDMDNTAKPDNKDTTATVPCLFCGRVTPVKVNGKFILHTTGTCFCALHVDKNTLSLPWCKSPDGLAYKSLGMSHLPHNKKLSSDKKSMIDFSMTQKDLSGNQ